MTANASGSAIEAAPVRRAPRRGRRARPPSGRPRRPARACVIVRGPRASDTNVVAAARSEISRRKPGRHVHPRCRPILWVCCAGNVLLLSVCTAGPRGRILAPCAARTPEVNDRVWRIRPVHGVRCDAVAGCPTRPGRSWSRPSRRCRAPRRTSRARSSPSTPSRSAACRGPTARSPRTGGSRPTASALPLLVVLHGRGQRAVDGGARHRLPPVRPPRPGRARLPRRPVPVVERGLRLLRRRGHAGHARYRVRRGRRRRRAARFCRSTPARVYLVGYSNGGKLAWSLACGHPALFAAVATYGAVPLTPCPASPAAAVADGRRRARPRAADRRRSDGPSADPVGPRGRGLARRPRPLHGDAGHRDRRRRRAQRSAPARRAPRWTSRATPAPTTTGRGRSPALMWTFLAARHSPVPGREARQAPKPVLA